MHMLSGRSQSEYTACCRIPTPWRSGKGQTMETGKRSVDAQDSGKEGGGTGRAQRIFQAVNLLWVKRLIHVLSKPTKHMRPGVLFNANCGHWVITVCQCGSISWKRTAQVGDIGSGRSWRWKWGWGIHGTLYLLLNFSINLKWKVKSIKGGKKTLKSKIP